MSNSHRRGPGAPVEKAKDFKGSILKLAKYMSEYKLSLIFVVVFAITSTVFNIIGPKLLGNATTEIFDGIIAKVNGTGDVNFDALGSILLLLIGFYLISSICSFIQGWLMTGVSQRVSYRLRKELIAKINRLPMNYFDRSTHGEALSRVEPEPEHNTARYICNNYYRRTHYDAVDKSAYDACCTSDIADIAYTRTDRCKDIAEVF